VLCDPLIIFLMLCRAIPPPPPPNIMEVIFTKLAINSEFFLTMFSNAINIKKYSLRPPVLPPGSVGIVQPPH
jgi:hypothetical protein